MCKTFYEAQFGVEIFIEFYEAMLSPPVFSYMFFIDFTVVVYNVVMVMGLFCDTFHFNL